MSSVGHVFVEYDDLSALNRAYARDERQHRGFADPVRADHANHLARRNLDGNVVEGNSRPVAMRDALQTRDDGRRHCGSLTCRSLGQAVAVLVRTMPRPRMPVFTLRLYCFNTSAFNWSLTRNISFSRSSWVS